MKFLEKIKLLIKKVDKKPANFSVKGSIMMRWAFANTLFCFVTFTIFTVLIYQITMTTYVNEERKGMIKAVDKIDNVMKKSEVPLTLQNLHNYIEFSTTPSYGIDASGEGIDSSAPEPLERLVGHRKSFLVYGVDRRLLYSSEEEAIGLQSSGYNKIIEYHGKISGFIVERKLFSQKTGEPIGYVQAIYDMTFYQNISRKLMASLSILEILALVIAQVAGYYTASRFIKPLNKLHKAMVKVAKNPKADFTPIKIDTGDEIEELADVFNTMMFELNNYMDRQQRFTYDASHELRTPLAVLDGHISMLNRWGKNDPEVLDESLKASLEETRRMKSLLEDMLTLSRIGNLKNEHLDEVTDVENACEGIVHNFLLLHPDIDLSFTSNLNLPFAKIYRNHYQQALTILVDNAIKYSPADRCSIQIRLFEEERDIVTEVEDHGYGIAPEDLEHVFDRFYRADKARNRDIGGTGLGLSIISLIASNYKGSVSVDSKQGVGSTFTLRIPKVDED